MSRRTASPLGGTIVLDCEGLSKLVSRQRTVMKWIASADAEDMRIITSATTVIETWHSGIDRARFAWTLSRVSVEPVTVDVARAATDLLADAGLHGHKYALDAALCATALRQPRPVVVLTSDPDDIMKLTSNQLRVVRV